MSTASPRRTGKSGVAIAVGYVVVCIATIALTGHSVRPLFDGIGPPAPYQWVKPPPDFAAGNKKPKPVSMDVALKANGSAASVVSTPDAQALLNLPEGAVAAHGADTKVTVMIVPLDPATLGPPPKPLHADGNAYRIALKYEPSGVAAGPLAKPGNVVLTVPQPAKSVLSSADGRAWQELASQSIGGTGSVGAAFNGGGYFLAGAHGTVTGTSSKSSTGRTLLIAGVVVVLALALPFLVTWLRRRRRPGRRRPRRR
jgi:hypothetical protein